MGPKPETLWNDVSEPTLPGTYKAGKESSGGKGSKGSGYAGSQSLASDAGKNYQDKQGSETSSQTTQTIGNGNVKKLYSFTPDGDDVGSYGPLWGGRGMGGY